MCDSFSFVTSLIFVVNINLSHADGFILLGFIFLFILFNAYTK